MFAGLNVKTFQLANLQTIFMPIVYLPEWNQFLSSHPNAHLLQTGEWGELKSSFGWKPVRIVSGEVGAQLLFRKLPLGFTVGYVPKLAINFQPSALSQEFWREIDSVCKKNRAIFFKLEPDLWNDQKLDALALSEVEGWNLTFRTSPHNIQPPRTLIIDIEDS